MVDLVDMFVACLFQPVSHKQHDNTRPGKKLIGYILSLLVKQPERTDLRYESLFNESRINVRPCRIIGRNVL